MASGACSSVCMHACAHFCMFELHEHRVRHCKQAAWREKNFSHTRAKCRKLQNGWNKQNFANLFFMFLFLDKRTSNIIIICVMCRVSCDACMQKWWDQVLETYGKYTIAHVRVSSCVCVYVCVCGIMWRFSDTSFACEMLENFYLFDWQWKSIDWVCEWHAERARRTSTTRMRVCT